MGGFDEDMEEDMETTEARKWELQNKRDSPAYCYCRL